MTLIAALSISRAAEFGKPGGRKNHSLRFSVSSSALELELAAVSPTALDFDMLGGDGWVSRSAERGDGLCTGSIGSAIFGALEAVVEFATK